MPLESVNQTLPSALEAIAPAGWAVHDEQLAWRIWRPDAATASVAGPVFTAIPLKGNPPGAGHLGRSVIVQSGLGAVGGAGWETLARSGVATLVGVDPDEYGDESVSTQPMLWRHRGRRKAWVQGQKARQINPAAHVYTAVGYAEDLPLWLLRAATVLVVAGDCEDLLLWAARMGSALEKPVVQGAVHGETGTAIVRGFSFTDPVAACPRCGQREHARRSSTAGCDPSAMRRQGQQPTRTLPTITALAGQLLATEALKWCTGAESLALHGEECTYSLWTHRSLRTLLPRHDDCRFAHERWLLADLPRPHGDTSLAMLAAQLSGASRGAPLWVRGEIPWISTVLCAACGGCIPVRRFARLGSFVGTCGCGADLVAGPRGMHAIVPRNDLADVIDQSLEQLGLGLHHAVGLLDGEQWVYFFPRASEAWQLPRPRNSLPEANR